ncbi:MAG: hypothetical protein RL088_240 [Verrucomicrobiota bacterium]|jgi:hypothetical protein
MKTIAAFIAIAALPASAQAPAAPATPSAKPAVVAESGAQTTAQAGEEPEKIVARFFSYLQRKDVDTAYDQLTRATKIAERPEDVKTLKTKTREAISVFGAIGGYEIVTKKAVGERLVRYTVVSLGKEFPLRWRFYFYKPAEAWKLIDMRVDDRLAAMFDEVDEDKAERP